MGWSQIYLLAAVDPAFLASLVHPARIALDELSIMYSIPIAGAPLPWSVVEVFAQITRELTRPPQAVTFRLFSREEEERLISRIQMQTTAREDIRVGLTKAALARSSKPPPLGRESVAQTAYHAAAMILSASQTPEAVADRLCVQIQRVIQALDGMDEELRWQRAGEYEDLLKEASLPAEFIEAALHDWEGTSHRAFAVEDHPYMVRQVIAAYVAPYRWFLSKGRTFLVLTTFSSKDSTLHFRPAFSDSKSSIPMHLSSFVSGIADGTILPLTSSPPDPKMTYRCRLLSQIHDTENNPGANLPQPKLALIKPAPPGELTRHRPQKM